MKIIVGILLMLIIVVGSIVIINNNMEEEENFIIKNPQTGEVWNSIEEYEFRNLNNSLGKYGNN